MVCSAFCSEDAGCIFSNGINGDKVTLPQASGKEIGSWSPTQVDKLFLYLCELITQTTKIGLK